jgi:UPF0271 protein
MQQAAQATGLRFAAEAFADRAYNPDGTLVSRQLPGSVLTDPAQAAAQVVRMVKEQIVLAHDGTRVVVAAETICLHGDNPSAAANAKAIRAALEGSGIEVVGL